MDTLPGRLISVDDHVIEHPDLWTTRVARKWRDMVPHVERTRATTGGWEFSGWEFVEDPNNPDAKPADVWIYEDTRVLMQRGLASVGYEREELQVIPLTYEDDMRPGCYDREARLSDMDQNNTEASLCFPSISRFCGQLFLNRKDQDLALECVRIYNDWMIDEWGGGPARGRLIPVTLIPLWDPKLAAAEVRRCADKGSHAIAFSECPPDLGLPSLYTDAWHPLFDACADTDTVINMHIGSSSLLPHTSPDAPRMAMGAIIHEKGTHALIDFILSGTLARFPALRIAMSEAQAGWVPFILERLDRMWERDAEVNGEYQLKEPPSSYVPGRAFFCVYDDVHALRCRDVIGIEQIMFEIDYPHGDSTWDYSSDVAKKLCKAGGLDRMDSWRLIRGNAIGCYGLDKYFGLSNALD
jgi:predicted TIM-barrel fold metal-dependent hydrolase